MYGKCKVHFTARYERSSYCQDVQYLKCSLGFEAVTVSERERWVETVFILEKYDQNC